MNQRLPIEAPPVGPQVADGSALLSGSNSSSRSSFTNASEQSSALAAPPVAAVAPPAEQLDAPNSNVPGASASEELDVQAEVKDFTPSSRRLPAAMLSFILHTVVLLLLAMVTVVPQVGDPNSTSVEFATGDGEQESELQSFEMLAAAGFCRRRRRCGGATGRRLNCIGRRAQ